MSLSRSVARQLLRSAPRVAAPRLAPLHRPAQAKSLTARLSTPHSVRFASTAAVTDPKAKASALIDALPGNSILSKTGWIAFTTAVSGAAISEELFVLNEEVVILGSFVVFLGYVSTLVREPYRVWADGQIQVRSWSFLALGTQAGLGGRIRS